MKTDIQRFFRHTGVYALGNVLYRGGSFVLVPLYAHALSPDEYGLLEIFTVTAGILQALLGAGIAHASLRFYYEYDDQKDRNSVFSTTLLGSFTFTGIAVVGLSFVSASISQVLLGTPQHALAFRIAFVTLTFELSREISLAFVRVREQSAFFVLMSVCQLVVQVTANVITVVVLKLGVIGILSGNLVSVLVVWSILSVNTVKECGWRVDIHKLRRIVAYGAPLMLSAISGSVLGSSDRYILNIHASLTALGVYALGLRIAQVIPVLIVDPFTKGFGPFRFAIMKNQDADSVYSRILAIYVLVASAAILALSLFAGELVALVSARAYSGASGIVPLLILPTAIGGVTYMFQTGIYFQKSTKHIFYISSMSGVVNLVLNLILIPRLSIYGAALSSLTAGLLSVVATYMVAQRIRPITYDLGPSVSVLFTALAAGAVGAAAFLLQPAVALPLKVLAIVAFLLLGSRSLGITLGHLRTGLRKATLGDA